jgi:hypothetical protein
LRLSTLEDSGFDAFSWIAYIAYTFAVTVFATCTEQCGSQHIYNSRD